MPCQSVHHSQRCAYEYGHDGVHADAGITWLQIDAHTTMTVQQHPQHDALAHTAPSAVTPQQAAPDAAPHTAATTSAIQHGHEDGIDITRALDAWSSAERTFRILLSKELSRVDVVLIIKESLQSS